MYDKTVRRRRLVLGLLVACSLILLTVYFGESAGGGGLHAVQRGATEIVSPVQDVASRALKPVRDLFGWFGDTLRAQGDVEKLREDRDALRQRLVDQTSAIRDVREREAVEALLRRPALAGTSPVEARVIGYDPNLWYSQLSINKGSSDGIRVEQPVVNGQGLVGVISFVSRGSATVRLLTDHNFNVGASVAESGVRGIVRPEAGRPDELVLDWIDGDDTVDVGQTVVTAGTVATVGAERSPYPRNIPIGKVTRVEDANTDDQVVHVEPFVDFRRVVDVRVLTTPNGGASK